MELWDFRGNKELIIFQFLRFKNNDILVCNNRVHASWSYNEKTTRVSAAGKMLFNILDCFSKAQKILMREHLLLVRNFSTVKILWKKKILGIIGNTQCHCLDLLIVHVICPWNILIAIRLLSCLKEKSVSKGVWSVFQLV